jgi:hypothetical protein
MGSDIFNIYAFSFMHAVQFNYYSNGKELGFCQDMNIIAMVSILFRMVI